MKLKSIRKKQNGFSIIELLIAVVIAAIIFAAFGQLLSASLTALSRSKARDDATNIATNVLSRAQAFNCGLTTGKDSSTFPFDAPLASTTALQNNCWGNSEYTDREDYSFIEGGLYGDSRFSFTSERTSRLYTVTFSANWVPNTTPSNTSLSYCDKIIAGASPLAIEYSVSVTWQRPAGIATDSVEMTSVESLPPDDNVLDLAVRSKGILVSSVAPESYHEVFGTYRQAKNGCAWFPFLPVNTSIYGVTTPIDNVTPPTLREGGF